MSRLLMPLIALLTVLPGLHAADAGLVPAGSLVAAADAATTQKGAPAPGGIQLLPGYEHHPLQGIDSTVGEIVRKDGFKIMYEQGRIPDPNSPFRLGGDFSNAAQRTPEGERAWYREQTVSGAPVHLVLTKRQSLIVTFPESGINFSTQIKEQSDLGDTLLMLLTFTKPQVKAK